MRSGLLILFLCLLLSGSLMAAGFGLGEFGARATGMGNAVTAQAYDASTLFYNPAGLGFLEGTNLYGGVTLIDPSANFVGAAPYLDNTVHQSKKQYFPPLGLYVAHRFSEKFAAGIGQTNPFGLGLAWEDDFPGRAISKDVTLQSFYITPAVAYRVNPNFSVSFGLDLVYTKLKLIRNVIMFNTPGIPGTGVEVGEAELEGGSGIGVGFTAGLMYRTEKLGLGVMYRHTVKNKFDDGEANFTVYSGLDPKVSAVANGLLKDQGVSTEIEFPNYAVAGIYYKIFPNLGLEVDAAWYGWEVFETLDLTFEDETLNQSIPENYENSWQFRVGVHYDFYENFSFRLGYIYDETPQPIESVSPLLPDDTRNDYTIGFGYKHGNFQFDAGYMFADIGERTTVENGVGKNDNGFNGTYNSNAHLFFFSIGYTIK
ncbi:MAG: outer membrane protein transport protein [Calditrichia bacterium]